MKKKIRRTKKNLNLMFLSSIFIGSLFFITIGYSLLYESLSVAGKGNLILPEGPVYSGDFSIEYSMEPWYSQNRFYYNCTMDFANRTNTNVEGWTITINVPNDSDMISCWNAECEVKNGVFTLKDLSYNNTLKPNEPIIIGFQIYTEGGEWSFSEANVNGVNIYAINKDDPNPQPTPTPTIKPTPTPTPTPIEDSLLKITINATNSWQSGGRYIKQYSYTVKNTSNFTMTSWKFRFGMPAGSEIVGAWDMNYIEANDYIIFSNGTWNGTLAPGDSKTLQFQLSSTTGNYTPTISNIEYTR